MTIEIGRLTQHYILESFPENIGIDIELYPDKNVTI